MTTLEFSNRPPHSQDGGTLAPMQWASRNSKAKPGHAEENDRLPRLGPNMHELMTKVGLDFCLGYER